MSKPHKWEIITVDATNSGLDIGEFWHCYECGTSGGPTGWGDGKPGVFGRFLAGTPLHNLDDDCAEAREEINAYVRDNKEYAEKALLERTRGSYGTVVPAVTEQEHTGYLTYKTCPVCGHSMVWDEVELPKSHDWCDECRDKVESLLFADDEDGEWFRRTLLEYPILAGAIREAVSDQDD